MKEQPQDQASRGQRGRCPSRARKNRRSQEWTFPWEPRSGQSYHIRHMRHFRRYSRHHSRHYKILFFDLNPVFFLTRCRVHSIRKNLNQANSHPERMYGFTYEFASRLPTNTWFALSQFRTPGTRCAMQPTSMPSIIGMECSMSA